MPDPGFAPVVQYYNNVHFEGIIIIVTPLCEVGARQSSICNPRAKGQRAANGQLEGAKHTQGCTNDYNSRKMHVITIITNSASTDVL